MMELPPEPATTEMAMDTLGTRSLSRRRSRAVPWVSVVLCGLLLSGMLAYQSMQTRRLQDAYAEVQAERDSLATVAETSRQERAKLETRVRSAAEQLVTMEEAVQRAKVDAESPARVAELEKLVLFLREELKAATQTIDQLRASQKQNTVLPAGVPN
jgi:hypothetical protein